MAVTRPPTPKGGRRQAVDQSVSTHRTAQAPSPQPRPRSSRTSQRPELQELTSFQRVLAPFAGTIIQRNVDVGALITAGSPTDNTAVAPSMSRAVERAVRGRADRELRVFVNVPQVLRQTCGRSAGEVGSAGTSTADRCGTVTRSASALDPGTRTLDAGRYPQQIRSVDAWNVCVRQTSRSRPRARAGACLRRRSSSTRKAPG